jgi:3-oxoacyl-[acyl-carrier protein] reductase
MTRQLLITGASSDIGISICRQYLSKNFRVLGLYNQGQTALTKLAEEHPELTLYQLNFESSEDTERFIQEEQEKLLTSDVIIHCAALLKPVLFSDITADDLLRAFTVNVIPSLLFERSLIPSMIKRGWGRIVNLSSIGVKFGGGSKTFCYSLSKHALEFFPRDHISWAARNVFINTIRVGVTDTRIHKVDPEKDMDQRISLIPLGRMATPDEIANTVFWLGSDQNSYITGQIITASGGE